MGQRRNLVWMRCDKCDKVQHRYPNAKHCYDDDGRICGRLRRTPPLAVSANPPTSKMVEAQDLHCADLFIFRDEAYLALACFTDTRHTQSIIIAVQETSEQGVDPTNVYALRLFRTFRVKVVGHRDVPTLHCVDNTREEIIGLPVPERT